MVAISPQGAPHAVRSLTGRRLWDFFVLGGASILLWPLFVVLQVDAPVLDGTDESPAATTLIAMLLLINYPHFMSSYKLGYGRGLPYVRARWPQLLVVPVILVILIFAGFALRDLKPGDVLLVRALDGLLAFIGASTRFAEYPTFGAVSLALLLHTMFLTVGWHYAKQTFGAMMVVGNYDGFRLALWQRRALRIHLLSVWWLNFVLLNEGTTTTSNYGFHLGMLGLPSLLVPLAWTIFVVTALIMAAALVTATRENGRPPGLLYLTPLVALWVWFVPLIDPRAFLIYVPTFHSLQYLAFIFRVESRRRQLHPPRSPPLSAVIFVGGLVLMGWISFMSGPRALDTWFDSLELVGGQYFFIAITTAINIHHYFIDNVIWRFDDREVQGLLLHPPRSGSA